MGEQDQPLAPGASRILAEENGVLLAEQSQREWWRRKRIICCGGCAAVVVILVIIILILAFTVFKVKTPTPTFNSVKIVGLDAALRQGNTPQPRLNMSFISDISIKNPNSASFKFTNATTKLFYGGLAMGDVMSPSGNARAHKTIHMNVTIDIMVDTVTRVSRLTSDLASGEMPMETYTNIRGRVNMLNIVKKHIDVELNCTVIVVLATQTVKYQVCKRTVHM